MGRKGERMTHMEIIREHGLALLSSLAEADVARLYRSRLSDMEWRRLRLAMTRRKAFGAFAPCRAPKRGEAAE